MEQDLQSLEYELQVFYRPVAPRNDFVSDLKKDLMLAELPRRALIQVLRTSAIVAFVVINVALLISTGIRATFVLMGALTLYRQARH